MKTPILIVILIVGAVASALAQTGNGPEPAPWWMRVEETQALFFKWLGFLTLAGGALVTLVVGIWVQLKTQVKEAKERLNRQTEDRQQLQAQVTDIAKQIPPSPPQTVLIDQQKPLETGSVLG